MIENYLNKEAKISIAFSYKTGYGIPQKIYGKVVRVNDEYIEIEFDPKKNNGQIKKTSGKMLVRKQYVISIVLI